MPGVEGYIGGTVVDGTEYCFYDGIPQSLEAQLSSSSSKTVRWVSVGYNDSWIVVYKDGSICWDGVADALSQTLQAGYGCDVQVRGVLPNHQPIKVDERGTVSLALSSNVE